MSVNAVLAGDYEGCQISFNEIKLPLLETCRIQKEIEAKGYRTVRSDNFKPLNKDFVESYQLIDSIDDVQKDVFSAMFRGGVGQMVFCNVGGVAGAATAKTATTDTKLLMCTFVTAKEA